MSGGSWNYIYRYFGEAAEHLKRSPLPERRALGELIEKCGRAMHDIEWVDSCDYGEGDEIEAIRKALGKNASALIMGEIVKEARRIYKDLGEAIEKEGGL